MPDALRRPTFDPALADVAVVVRDDGRWRLDVLRFTGDVLASTPLHVEGAFQARVLSLVTRLLGRRGVARLGRPPRHLVDAPHPGTLP
ncbi:hypothetical protein [Herbiconiux sp. VKM Ac-2851]|uniref:hypothetical protein n=1 Tax=Herbiconiux sp. VKM Ac-2851 TaxID=2739025 RepID=UPI001563CFE2|nr:hypothetical protein [Herbiconiux sp. VKM Ac-2851]NQX34472.1 hypothetical protein [Herbiconiux sp. VKM Ac-2851]